MQREGRGEPSYFTPDLAREAFWTLYTETEPRVERHFRMGGWEADLGLSERAAHKFFPPSVLQGPLRWLLLYSFATGLRLVVDLCNHAASSFAKAQLKEVSIVAAERSPNGRPHIHEWRLWTIGADADLNHAPGSP